MKKGKKNVVIVVLLLLLTVTAGFAVYTYAKYTSTLNRTGVTRVAKWAFDTDNPGSTINFTLDQTYNANTLVSGRIAPGTSGSMAVQLSNANSEVGVSYSVKVGTITGKPANLKFYSDSSYQNELTPGTTTVTGTLTPRQAASASTTVTIYWKWEYDVSSAADVQDTTDGAAAAGLTIPVEITGTQVQPTV